MKRFSACVLFVIVSAFSSPATAQVRTDDSLANRLVERYRKISAAKMTRPGYRIQIYFGTDRVRAQELRAEFMRSFPELGAYLVYQQPNFKVRVGDFRTRLEAQGFLRNLNDRFTPSFIVPDEVKLPVMD